MFVRVVSIVVLLLVTGSQAQVRDPRGKANQLMSTLEMALLYRLAGPLKQMMDPHLVFQFGSTSYKAPGDVDGFLKMLEDEKYIKIRFGRVFDVSPDGTTVNAHNYAFINDSTMLEYTMSLRESQNGEMKIVAWSVKTPDGGVI